MSREIRTTIHDIQPHPMLCGAFVVSVLIPGHARSAITEHMEATLVIPEADNYARSADV